MTSRKHDEQSNLKQHFFSQPLGSQWTTVKHNLQIVRLLPRWWGPQLKTMYVWSFIRHIAQKGQSSVGFKALRRFPVQQRLVPSNRPLHVWVVPLHSSDKPFDIILPFIIKAGNFQMGCCVGNFKKAFGLLLQYTRPNQQGVLTQLLGRHLSLH